MVRGGQPQTVAHPTNRFLHQMELLKTLFHVQESVKIKNELLEAHLYFDQERSSEPSLRFLSFIFQCFEMTFSHTTRSKPNATTLIICNGNASSYLSKRRF